MQKMFLESGDLHIEWLVEDQYVHERISVRRDAGWIAIAHSDPVRPGLQSVVYATATDGVTAEHPVLVDSWDVTDDRASIHAHAGEVPLRISWQALDGYLRAELRAEFAQAVDLESIRSRYLYAPNGQPYSAIRPLDLVFTPNLRPLEHDVIGDHRFHVPAVILQKDALGFAFLPDISHLVTMRIRRIKTSLNYDVLSGAPHPLIEYGFLDWEGRDHVFYRHRPGATIPTSNQQLVYGFLILAGAQAAPASYHRPVTHHYYLHHLAPALRARPQLQCHPFGDWERHAWYEFAEQHWWQAELDGEPIGNISSNREFVPGRLWHPTLPDGWFNHWFQSLRTALGMHRSGRRLDDPRLLDRARRILNLCLSAPQRDGAFPVVAYWDAAAGCLHWERDNTWAGLPNWYHSFDMCWTAYWLLAWHEELAGAEPRILPRCCALGDFLLRNQLPSGCIPSFYDADLAPNRRYLYDDNAETAGCAVFLFRLAAVTADTRYLDGAARSMAYIRDEVIPINRWFDFETFFSCSAKPVTFVCPHTDQLPQNNLSIIQACLGFLLWHRATGEPAALAAGERLVDYLSLFQQVWSPPWLTPDLLGGFATQNTDAEWSDARQCYAADLYFAYYEATRSREYFERAVAALRASFPVAPYENWAHRLEDVHGSWTGIHWGTGSAITSVLLAAPYGDAFVDAHGGWGAGLDGCTVEAVALAGNDLSVIIVEAFARSRPLSLVVRTDRPLRVSVNGRPYGMVEPPVLAAGLAVDAT